MDGSSTDTYKDPQSKWWLSDGQFVGFRVIRVEAAAEPAAKPVVRSAPKPVVKAKPKPVTRQK